MHRLATRAPNATRGIAAPYSVRVIQAYTHDITRRPQPTKAEQTEHLDELVNTKIELWMELMRVAPNAVETFAAKVSGDKTRRSKATARKLAIASESTQVARDIVANLEGSAATQATWLCDAALRMRAELVRANLRLVFAVARRFVSHHVHYEDMVADGNMGLFKAVDHFDPHYKVQFSTYAVHWIRHEIARGIDDRGRTVRIPVNARILRREMKKHRIAAADRGERLDDHDVAARCGVRVDRIRQIDRDTAPVLRLDLANDDGPDYQREDVVDPREHPDDTMLRSEHLSRIRELLPKIHPKRAYVLRHRFGLDGAPELTLAEIGKRLGLSRERIRQHEVNALEDLREMLERDPPRRRVFPWRARAM